VAATVNTGVSCMSMGICKYVSRQKDATHVNCTEESTGKNLDSLRQFQTERNNL